MNILRIIAILRVVIPAVEVLFSGGTGEEKHAAAVSLTKELLEFVELDPELETAINQLIPALVSVFHALGIFQRKSE